MTYLSHRLDRLAAAVRDNAGYATSMALTDVAGAVEEAVGRVIRAYQNHAEVLRGNADRYDRTEEQDQQLFS